MSDEVPLGEANRVLTVERLRAEGRERDGRMRASMVGAYGFAPADMEGRSVPLRRREAVVSTRRRSHHARADVRKLKRSCYMRSLGRLEV
jgi:hypothetical protein